MKGTSRRSAVMHMSLVVVSTNSTNEGCSIASNHRGHYLPFTLVLGVHVGTYFTFPQDGHAIGTG